MNIRNKKQRWKRWLEKDLFPEIRYLIKLKTVYKKLEDIFVGSKKYPEKSYFYWYLGQVHSATAITGLYRLIDKRKDVVSLINLLGDVKVYPELVSRRAYTRLANIPRNDIAFTDEKKRLNKEFTQRAGNGLYINPSIINKDIKQIESLSKIIKKIRHKFIGHHAYNQRRYRTKPTFKQTYDCIDEFEKIFRKYHLLITGGDIKVISNYEKQKIENDLALIFKESNNTKYKVI